MKTSRTENPAPARIGTLIVFILIMGVFAVLNRAIKPPAILLTERRQPAKLPDFTFKNIADAEFMNGFEAFAADSFALREPLRSLRAATVFYALGQADKSGLYRDSAVGAGRFVQVDELSLRQTAAKLRKVAEPLQELDMQIYYAVIPDKSIYATQSYPGFDPALAAAILGMELPDFTPVDLTPALSADAYYRTDLHWNQVKLEPVLNTLGTAMGVPFGGRARMHFQGVYAGQLALPMDFDDMKYIELPNSVTARYLNDRSMEWEARPIYKLEALTDLDPYDLFLGGPQPLIILENPNANTNRTLYLFRDSFGSSLAPLLTTGYRRIVLIDLRYIHATLLPQFIDWEAGADVLFLYSSQLLNNAGVLMV
ncbi:MAG: hypothetical protein FWF10_03200 [Clostridiales bacterium]|nr:hypothetical protein [Clostridiales bacterium]